MELKPLRWLVGGEAIDLVGVEIVESVVVADPRHGLEGWPPLLEIEVDEGVLLLLEDFQIFVAISR